MDSALRKASLVAVNPVWQHCIHHCRWQVMGAELSTSLSDRAATGEESEQPQRSLSGLGSLSGTKCATTLLHDENTALPD